MSAVVTIKNQLIAKIQTCPSVQAVFGWEELNPTAFPAVMLTPASMEGEFSSNVENSRIYSYTALILFPIGQDFETPKTQNRIDYAENVIATVIDEISNAIDDDFELDGTPVLYVNAVDVTWEYVQADFGEARAARVTLKVYTEVNIS